MLTPLLLFLITDLSLRPLAHHRLGLLFEGFTKTHTLETVESWPDVNISMHTLRYITVALSSFPLLTMTTFLSGEFFAFHVPLAFVFV